MNKYFSVTAAALVSVGAANAQGLFDIAPNDEVNESLPLRWTASVSVGHDDNPTPLAAGADSSSYVAAYLGASVFNHTPQTTWDLNARVGYLYYLDDLAGTTDEGSPQARLAFNWHHRVSERVRLSSRNFVSYENEPEYNLGFNGAQQAGEYLYWSTDTAIGYRWSERLGTYTGITFSGIEYDDVVGLDRNTVTLYNQFRYQLTPRTVATFDYRYVTTDGGSVSDTDSHFFLVGLEQRFNPNTVGVIKAGVNFRDVDGGSSSTNPHLELALRSRVNEKFAFRSYLRYSVEDYLRNINGNVFENSNTLRLGIQGDYSVSSKLTLTGGINYLLIGYEDSQTSQDVDENLLNLYARFNYRLSHNLSLNGTYNYSTYDSDVAARDYDRNRFDLGLTMTF